MRKINIRAIIIAAGKATRWNDYKKTNKHFIEIDHEPILHRTVRLLRENHVDDIWIIGKDKQYKTEGSNLYIPKFTKEYGDADKFLSSRELWSKEGKTLVIYGDVYFTEDAIQQIVHYRHEDWLLFARPFGSRLTGKGCGECFAQTFYPNHLDAHEKALWKLVEYYKEKRLLRIGGWEHYRIMIGLPEDIIHKQMIGDRFVEINDWTDDFDRPEDFENFIRRYKVAKKASIKSSEIGDYRCNKCGIRGEINKDLKYYRWGRSVFGKVKQYLLLCDNCPKLIDKKKWNNRK